MRSVEKELASFKIAQILASASSLVAKSEKISGLELISAELEPEISGDDLRTIALDLRNRIAGGVVVLASKGDERSTLVVACSSEAITVGVKAGALVKAGSEILGGGGGKDDFAQGGGINHQEITSALSAIKKLVGQAAGK